MDNVFRSKVDWWLPTFIFSVLTFSAITVLMNEESGVWAVFLVLAVGLLALWMFRSFRCLLTGVDLTVVVGPFRLHYPYHEIVLVRKGGWWAQVSSIREPRVRLAFSMDNLIVESRRRGKPRRIVISPGEAGEFLRQMKERAPQAEFRGFG